MTRLNSIYNSKNQLNYMFNFNNTLMIGHLKKKAAHINSIKESQPSVNKTTEESSRHCSLKFFLKM